MNKYKTTIIGLIILCFFLYTNYLVSKYINNNMKNSSKKTQEELRTKAQANLSKKKDTKTTSKKYKLVPEDPAKYGIISLDSTQVPRYQSQWDAQMKSLIIDSKLLETAEGKEALEKMKTDPENFNKMKSKVEERIAHFEKIHFENPSDTEAEKRLQKLYRLKAISKLLEEKVVNLSEDSSEVSTE